MIRNRSAIPGALALLVVAACADSGEPTGAARPETPEASRSSSVCTQKLLGQVSRVASGHGCADIS